LVRFFGKQPGTTGKEAVVKAPAKAPPGPPARTSAAAAKAAAAPAAAPAPAPAEAVEEKKTRTRRAPVRPPRRDWAAEAAAAPVGAPAPAPTSLATSPAMAPVEDGGDGTAAPTKRRRGTRGGRGRKKPGTTAATAETPALPAAVAPMPVLKESVKKGEPLSLEALVAHQAAVLESFASQVTASLQALQVAIAGLQGGAAPTATGQQRVGIFVDVPNLIYASERRGINLDFGRMLDYFTRGRQLVRASAYAPISDDPQARLESQRFVHHFVGHPYRVITKPLKRFADGSMKANFDIELAIDILTMSDRLDVVVLMSGDGDFRRLVEILSSRGVRVEIVAFSESASMELKTVADLYVDIGSHLDDFRVLK
jgi:uncharacterized LabA/DUF88 family protein